MTMIMILIMTKSKERKKKADCALELWRWWSGTYQGSFGLKKGMNIRSVRESMPVRLCKNTEERIGHLVRFNMT